MAKILDRLGRLWPAAKTRPFRWRKVIGRRWATVIAFNATAPRPVMEVGAAEVASRYVALPSIAPYRRTPPEIHGLEEWQRDEIKAHLAAPEVNAPCGGLAIMEKASVVGGGVVMTKTGQIVRESLANTTELLRLGPLSRATLSDPLTVSMGFHATQRRLSSEPHVLLKQNYDSNYGHWLIEGLPRIAIAADHVDLDHCKVIVSDYGEPMKKVYRDSLAVFGIRPDQIVEVDFEEVHIDTLIYPLPMARHQWQKSPRAIKILEGLPDRIGVQGSTPRRIYVSRNRYRKRRLVNEAEIIEICRANGIDILYPEDLTFADQVRLFSRAELVIGNCGANLTNIVFAPHGCALFALATETMANGFFWDLADVKGGRYVSLHGRAVEAPSDAMQTDAPHNPFAAFDSGIAQFLRDMDRDFVIDPRQFMEVLKGLLH